jgi:hypothetical protein
MRAGSGFGFSAAPFGFGVPLRVKRRALAGSLLSYNLTSLPPLFLSFSPSAPPLFVSLAPLRMRPEAHRPPALVPSLLHTLSPQSPPSPCKLLLIAAVSALSLFRSRRRRSGATIKLFACVDGHRLELPPSPPDQGYAYDHFYELGSLLYGSLSCALTLFSLVLSLSLSRLEDGTIEAAGRRASTPHPISGRYGVPLSTRNTCWLRGELVEFAMQTESRAHHLITLEAAGCLGPVAWASITPPTAIR